MFTSLVCSAFVCFHAQAVPTSRPAAPKPQIVSVEKIWDAAPHNAFTDLIRFKDRWFCTFRESEAHVGGDGRIRLIESRDGKTWTSAALLEEKGVDLRDPKLSITPDGRLMVVAGGVAGYVLSFAVENIIPYLLPFAAGGFIYIAASDLMPEIRKERVLKKSVGAFLVFLMGIAIMFAAKFIGE